VVQKASLCRFGDGEIQLLKGVDIPFQKASLALTDRLKEILSSKDPSIFIGIPRMLYGSKQNIVPFAKYWWRENGQAFRNTLEKYIDLNHTYYMAEVTLAFSLFEQYDLHSYFEEISKLWKGLDITVVCGDSVFEKIDYNIFDSAQSIEYLWAPSLNAFDSYEDLLKRCKSIPTERLVIAVLGPTATVLAYDLAKKGYQCLDLGHIAKSYDWFKKHKLAREQNDAVDFFNPD
jgi:glycosyltransferase family protein